MGIDVEEIKKFLPYYLSEDQKVGLVRELRNFPKNFNYYTSLHKEEFLQGDGWPDVEILRFEDGARSNVKGMLISNSCDVSPENDRATPTKAIFAPLVPLDRYENLLNKSDMNRVSVEGKIAAIREQKVTSIFFLPKGGGLGTDHIAILDDLHSIPSDYYLSKKCEKLFTLSMMGFYLLTMKLSIHFCRMHENVIRSDVPS